MLTPEREAEIRVRDMATLLFAADAVHSDDMDFWDAAEYARGVARSLMFAPWAGGKHSGDCTKEPMTCARCLIERYEDFARMVIESDDEIPALPDALRAQVAALEEALRKIEQRRESWYDAMGDDEAGPPSEEAEACWEIAIEALRKVRERK